MRGSLSRAFGSTTSWSEHLEGRPEPIVIKIDVEGHELEVFNGAAATIASYRPFILFESVDVEGDDRQTARAARRFISAQDYALFIVRGTILAPRDADDPQEGVVSDFLAVPSEKLSNFAPDGFDVRPLSDAERQAWLAEMASGSELHRRHASAMTARHPRGNSSPISR